MFTELSELAGKKILVVGLGKTGVSLTQLLVKHGAVVTVTDHKSKPELSNQLEQLDGLEIKYELGGHSPKTFLQQDLVILSPGIPSHLKIFEYARNQGVRITGEFEFITQFIKEPIVAITGTNGKTTIARLLEAMFKESGMATWVGGNMGTPLSDYLRLEVKSQVVIAEISSFMLEQCERFSPACIIFTNLAENHLDRYRSMEDYINAKRKIFKNVGATTTSILNADDNAVVELARDPVVQKGRIMYFSRKASFEPQIMNIGGSVNIGNELKMRISPDEIETYTTDKVKMRGKHSIENMMAASLAARQFGASKEAVQKVIDSYYGLPHRIEYVKKIGGVKFFNDSKSTNVHSVIRALEAFDESIILIMGGKEANISFESLKGAIKHKVKSLILVGESKERINRDIGDFSETFLIGTFEEAVVIAFQKSRSGDVILLSPGCPSFDTFDSYEERGNYFKEIVKKF